VNLRTALLNRRDAVEPDALFAVAQCGVRYDTRRAVESRKGEKKRRTPDAQTRPPPAQAHPACSPALPPRLGELHLPLLLRALLLLARQDVLAHALEPAASPAGGARGLRSAADRRRERDGALGRRCGRPAVVAERGDELLVRRRAGRGGRRGGRGRRARREAAQAKRPRRRGLEPLRRTLRSVGYSCCGGGDRARRARARRAGEVAARRRRWERALGGPMRRDRVHPVEAALVVEVERRLGALARRGGPGRRRRAEEGRAAARQGRGRARLGGAAVHLGEDVGHGRGGCGALGGRRLVGEGGRGRARRGEEGAGHGRREGEGRRGRGGRRGGGAEDKGRRRGREGGRGRVERRHGRVGDGRAGRDEADAAVVVVLGGRALVVVIARLDVVERHEHVGGRSWLDGRCGPRLRLLVPPARVDEGAQERRALLADRARQGSRRARAREGALRRTGSCEGGRASQLCVAERVEEGEGTRRTSHAKLLQILCSRHRSAVDDGPRSRAGVTRLCAAAVPASLDDEAAVLLQAGDEVRVLRTKGSKSQLCIPAALCRAGHAPCPSP